MREIAPHTRSLLLTFHLLGGLLLVGGSIAVSIVSLAALRQRKAELVVALRRMALRTNLFAVIPGLVLAYAFGSALASKEHIDKHSPTWLDIAFPLVDVIVVVGGILLSLLQWWVLRRARAGRPDGWQARTASYVAPAVLAGLFAVVFLMAGKPGS